MKQWTSILLLCVAVTGGLAVLDSFLWTEAAASDPDRDPPVVLVEPSETQDAGDPLIVNARILDPSGIGPVVLWVRGENDDEFKQVPMEQVGDEQVQVELARWPGLGSYMEYYIEARDGEGNGPGFAGAPRTPYIMKFKGQATAPVEAKPNWLLWGVTAGVLIALVGGYFLYRHAARAKLHAELNAELMRLTGGAYEPAPVPKATAPKSTPRKAEVQIPQNPEEQAFWIGLLTPLGEMHGLDRDQALQNMAVRAHYHPTLGKRFFDVGTLTRHLKWVERGEIEVTAEMVTAGLPRMHKPVDS